MSNALPVYAQHYSDEERKLADHLIGLEKSALDKWFKGDTSGYESLWSERSFSYFDAVVTERVDDYETIKEFLKSIDGKLFADSYDFRHPRIQAVKDMAVLTYQLYAKTNLIDMEYNVIEVFQREEDNWKVIHSTWSFIRPMDKKFPGIATVV
ncbi:nuclear transport factor 2 family protein [Rosenbergiella sp. S61]|uniref:Nuclear transport factor 2 family protein n=1 Tax=Rosenbergiella gaditana TaxID=2726987 RepID=A0ABS5SSA3_9GAMM|nr:nuclear transport factor 2 family protein [Rosenbergiella gaditana]MBT0722859.1 nuclear transport factor 2 family protein [Rosenbergiella gaditana]